MNLHVFDFDGTIFRKGPKEPEGEVPEEWFSTLASLTPPAIPFQPPPIHFIKPTMVAAKSAMSDPFSFTMLLTGREVLFETRVKQLLRQVGVTFDLYVFRPPFAPTLEYKIEVLQKILLISSSVTHIDLWEDSEENLMAQLELCKEFAPTEGHLVVSRHLDDPV